MFFVMKKTENRELPWTGLVCYTTVQQTWFMHDLERGAKCITLEYAMTDMIPAALWKI